MGRIKRYPRHHISDFGMLHRAETSIVNPKDNNHETDTDADTFKLNLPSTRFHMITNLPVPVTAIKRRNKYRDLRYSMLATVQFSTGRSQ